MKPTSATRYPDGRTSAIIAAWDGATIASAAAIGSQLPAPLHAAAIASTATTGTVGLVLMASAANAMLAGSRRGAELEAEREHERAGRRRSARPSRVERPLTLVPEPDIAACDAAVIEDWQPEPRPEPGSGPLTHEMPAVPPTIPFQPPPWRPQPWDAFATPPERADMYARNP